MKGEDLLALGKGAGIGGRGRSVVVFVVDHVGIGLGGGAVGLGGGRVSVSDITLRSLGLGAVASHFIIIQGQFVLALMLCIENCAYI